MIKVTTQQENRLYAINKMASAIEQLDRALCVGTKVEINNNTGNQNIDDPDFSYSMHYLPILRK